MPDNRERFLTETPYSRLKTLGPAGMSLLDLLALGLAESESDQDRTEQVARGLAPSLQKLRGIGELSANQLAAAGVSDFAAARCIALIELGRRLNYALKGPLTQVSCAEVVAEALSWLRFEKREHFVAVLLDTQNVILKVSTIHIGTLTSSIVGPREVFREAIREGASSLIVAHNHPSGDATPSPEDLDLTKKLVELGRALDIPVLDHVIIGEGQFRSLREAGLLS